MKTVGPGGTLGILGGGQLGRMIALAARPLDIRTICFDPTAGGPAAQVCDEAVVAPFSDENAAVEMARRCGAVTLEWENVPAELVDAVAKAAPVFPGASVLRTIQDRLTQREFLKSRKFPQTDFAKADHLDDVRAFGFPCVVKTRRHGYDGKGQAVVKSDADLPKAAALLQEAKLPCIAERFVAFDKEISVILARGRDGSAAVFPLAENIHKDGILHTTFAPARVPLELGQKAAVLALGIADALGHVGVMAVELFVVKDTLLVNEIAPRVHNSGHYTLGACVTSQFEQHARAVCGLPLGDPAPTTQALMVNLLGDLWAKGEPLWDRALSRGDVKLHLYGKSRPAAGRKMGHLIVLGERAGRPGLGDELLRGLVGG